MRGHPSLNASQGGARDIPISSVHSRPHVTEPSGRCTVSGTHGLHRLAFAAVWSPPEPPVPGARNRIARVPELRGHARIRAVLQEPPQFALLDLVSDLRAELEVEPHVVDAP